MCSSSDEYALFEYICEKDARFNFPFPFFLDKKNDYITVNLEIRQTSENIYDAIVTNKRNQILFNIDPLFSDRAAEILENKLKELNTSYEN